MAGLNLSGNLIRATTLAQRNPMDVVAKTREPLMSDTALNAVPSVPNAKAFLQTRRQQLTSAVTDLARDMTEAHKLIGNVENSHKQVMGTFLLNILRETVLEHRQGQAVDQIDHVVETIVSDKAPTEALNHPQQALALQKMAGRSATDGIEFRHFHWNALEIKLIKAKHLSCVHVEGVSEERGGSYPAIYRGLQAMQGNLNGLVAAKMGGGVGLPAHAQINQADLQRILAEPSEALQQEAFNTLLQSKNLQIGNGITQEQFDGCLKQLKSVGFLMYALEPARDPAALLTNLISMQLAQKGEITSEHFVHPAGKLGLLTLQNISNDEDSPSVRERARGGDHPLDRQLLEDDVRGLSHQVKTQRTLALFDTVLEACRRPADGAPLGRGAHAGFDRHFEGLARGATQLDEAIKQAAGTGDARPIEAASARLKNTFLEILNEHYLPPDVSHALRTGNSDQIGVLGQRAIGAGNPRTAMQIVRSLISSTTIGDAQKGSVILGIARTAFEAGRGGVGAQMMLAFGNTVYPVAFAKHAIHNNNLEQAVEILTVMGRHEVDVRELTDQLAQKNPFSANQVLLNLNQDGTVMGNLGHLAGRDPVQAGALYLQIQQKFPDAEIGRQARQARLDLATHAILGANQPAIALSLATQAQRQGDGAFAVELLQGVRGQIGPVPFAQLMNGLASTAHDQPGLLVEFAKVNPDPDFSGYLVTSCLQHGHFAEAGQIYLQTGQPERALALAQACFQIKASAHAALNAGNPQAFGEAMETLLQNSDLIRPELREKLGSPHQPRVREALLELAALDAGHAAGDISEHLRALGPCPDGLRGAAHNLIAPLIASHPLEAARLALWTGDGPGAYAIATGIQAREPLLAAKMLFEINPPSLAVDLRHLVQAQPRVAPDIARFLIQNGGVDLAAQLARDVNTYQIGFQIAGQLQDAGRADLAQGITQHYFAGTRASWPGDMSASENMADHAKSLGLNAFAREMFTAMAAGCGGNARTARLYERYARDC